MTHNGARNGAAPSTEPNANAGGNKVMTLQVSLEERRQLDLKALLCEEPEPLNQATSQVLAIMEAKHQNSSGRFARDDPEDPREEPAPEPVQRKRARSPSPSAAAPPPTERKRRRANVQEDETKAAFTQMISGLCAFGQGVFNLGVIAVKQAFSVRATKD